jgi:hypothetical protein
MLSYLRRAFKAFIGPPIQREEPPPLLSDKEIVKEYFREPPVPAETKQRFHRLSEIIHAHLDQETGRKRGSRIAAKLKPGVSPREALSSAIQSGGKQSIAHGVAIIDWKAREELQWLANSISKSHGLLEEWCYDWQKSPHKGFDVHNEIPIEAPLRDFASWLSPQGLTLFAISVDDSLIFFATRQELAIETVSICKDLGINVLDMTSAGGTI